MGIELFERAADAGGRILRVEQLVSADGPADPECGPGYLLTFDVGRILVAADPREDCLLLRHVDSADELEAIRLAPLDEEEPWWRVAGNPITRAWPGVTGAEVGAGPLSDVRMQFREDDDNPRVVSLRYERGAVRVALEVPDGG